MKTSLRMLFPLLLVALFGLSYGQTPIPTQSPDLFPSGYVDMMDLFVLSASWKAMTGPQYGDLDGNGTVGAEDLLSVLGEWHEIILTTTPTPTTTPTATPSPLPQTITIDNPGLPEGARPMRLIRIPEGSFQMGSPETERGRDSDEGPVHTVTLTHDFYIGETEVTQAQWQALMGSNPATDLGHTSYGVGNDYPVYYLTWNDCQSFLSALNALGQGTFRLPSEAEWEYACRGSALNPNRYAPFSFGDDLSVSDLYSCQFSNLFDQYMWWCWNNSPYESKPVGGKLPNDLGLYDMHGNVWEWCQDWYHTSYSGAPTDGSSWNSQQNRYPYRVIRGGHWNLIAGYCRSATRYSYSPDFRSRNFGFRLARTP